MVTAIILAAGQSSRFGGEVNKNLTLTQEGRPVLSYSVAAFAASPEVDEILITAMAGEEAAIQAAADTVAPGIARVITGGRDRMESVYRALCEAKGEQVLIHDGARAMLQQQYITDCLAALAAADGVSVGIPSQDTVKICRDDGTVEATTCRKNTWLVQTPQAFCREVLIRCHEACTDRDAVTDDCMLLEAAGYTVRMVPGHVQNLKVTTQQDLTLLNYYLSRGITE